MAIVRVTVMVLLAVCVMLAVVGSADAQQIPLGSYGQPGWQDSPQSILDHRGKVIATYTPPPPYNGYAYGGGYYNGYNGGYGGGVFFSQPRVVGVRMPRGYYGMTYRPQRRFGW